MIGFELLRPGLLWLVLLAPLALAAGWLALARSRAELARWVSARHRERFLPGASEGRARARVVLGSLALLFLALAALGPVRGYTYRPVSRRGLDLVVCLDTSRSMLAQDLRPSRLERAKREIVGLLDHLQGDRVALVAFSGDARDVAPLTRDRQTLKGLLGYVTPDDNQEGGTDLAAAIEHALAMFDGRTGAHEAIVLLTDGEDLEGHASAQAEEAEKRGIRLFVVGIGTEAGGKIPIVEAGGRSAFLKDEQGQEVVTKLGRESLAMLAATTGGEFLSAEEAPTALEDLYRARIRRIQGREIESGERRVPYDRFQWPLALGLACLLLDLAWRVRRSGREEQGAAPRLAAALLPLFAPLAPQEPFEPGELLASAVRHHRSNEPEAAEQAARALLGHASELSEPEQAKVHFTLGVVAATRAIENPEEGEPQRAAARDAFSAARALAGPGELREDATYDLGALELFHAESVRATIPEISGQPPAAPGALGTPPGAPPAAPPGPEKDPLKEARALYGAAKEWFLERLRLGWQDEDTRANLELIQRRLHELDRLEKQREEQQQQQQGSDQNQPDQNEKDKQDKQDSQDQKGQQDQKDQKNPQDDPDAKDEQKDGQKDAEKKDQPRSDAEQKDPKEQQQRPEEAENKDGSESEPPKDAQQEPAERVLTREEVMQLLDKLAELEKQQKAIDAALRAKRRAAKKRDW